MAESEAPFTTSPPESLAELARFLAGETPTALLAGDAQAVLATLPAGLADCCLTSPPYWAQRAYDNPDGFGREQSPQLYVARLVAACREIARVLKPEGSLWLNLGDTYHRKHLVGIPWRVALALGEDGWILPEFAEVVYEAERVRLDPSSTDRDLREATAALRALQR